MGLNCSGTVSDRVSIDARASGDFFDTSPGSTVTLGSVAGAMTTPGLCAALRKKGTRVMLPGHGSLAELVVTLFDAETGHLQFGAAEAAEDAEGAGREGRGFRRSK